MDAKVRQLVKIISVEHGHVGLTVDPIILKDLCRLMYPLLLELRQPTFFFPSTINLALNIETLKTLKKQHTLKSLP
jgi:hypothetical protein